MSTIKVLNMAGAEVGTVELCDSIFGIEPNQAVVHEVVKNHLANCRQGTCLLYTSPSPRDRTRSRMPSSA